jgi:hypothetical protein
MSITVNAERAQIARQIAHWRAATVTLDDADNFASPAAWANLEDYLGLAIRRQLQAAVDRLKLEIEGIRTQAAFSKNLPELEATRQRLVAFRKRFVKTETTLDFYGEAVGTRTNPKLTGLLRACDILAERSMAAALVPLGHPVPPVLSYIDKGLGASILRAGIRLWDGGSISPAAAIKITRHNLYRPTSLIHEAGHQVAHILGWNEDLRHALAQELARDSSALSHLWSSWASEIAADVFAFVNTGYAAVAALHDVIAGEEDQVFAVLPGDPHPVAYLRVLLNVRFCCASYGTGPWDDLEAAWRAAYPLADAPPSSREAIEMSDALVPRIVDICLTRPSRAFGNRPIVSLIDPNRVRPEELRRMAEASGPAVHTSHHWISAEALRLLAWSGLRMATEPDRTAEVAEQYESWMLRLGAVAREHAAIA